MTGKNSLCRVNKIRILFTNIYVLHIKNHTVMIDTGPPIKKSHFLKILARHGLMADGIDYLVLTHTHFDHSGNAHILKEMGTKIIVHKNESQWLSNGETPVPPGKFDIGSFLIKFSRIKSFEFPPVKPDIVLEQEHSVIPEMDGLEFFHTPGHTKGSITVVIKNRAYCGDLIMNLSLYKSNHYMPIFADSLEEVQESINRLIQSGVTVFYPAHGKRVLAKYLKA